MWYSCAKCNFAELAPWKTYSICTYCTTTVNFIPFWINTNTARRTFWSFKSRFFWIRLSCLFVPIAYSDVLLFCYAISNPLRLYSLLCLSALTTKSLISWYYTVVPMKPCLGMEFYLHPFLTSALNGMHVILHATATLLGAPLNRRLGWSQSRSGRFGKKNFLTPVRYRTTIPR